MKRAAGWCGLLLASALAGKSGSEEAIPSHPSALSFAEPEIAIPAPDPYRFTLSNGMAVVIVPDHALPLFDLELAVRAGGFLDPPGQAGLAYLTAALLAQGGTAALPAPAFADRIDFLGLELGAAGRVTRSGMHWNAPSWVQGEVFDLFADLLRRPRPAPELLAAAQAQLQAAMPHRLDDPRAVAAREWVRLLFGEDHPLARDLTPATLSAISASDLLAFQQRYWHPANLVLAVSGDVEPAQIVAELERRLAEPAPSSGSPSEAVRVPWPPPFPDHRPEPGLYHREQATPHSQIFLGHPLRTVPDWDSADRPGLLVLAELLGGGAIARLAGRLRTAEGLVYAVDTALELGPELPGQFRVSFATTPALALRALVSCRQELQRLLDEPVQPFELEIAKREVRAELQRSFDSAAEIAGYWAEDLLIGRPHAYWQALPRTVAQVSARDVQTLARRFLAPDALVVLVVGPWDEIRAGAAQAGIEVQRLGPITHLPARDPLTLKPRNSASD